MAMRNSFVEQLLECDESNRLVRLKTVSMTAIQKAVCALLNGEGGWIVVGVDQKGQAVGVKDVEKVMLSIRASLTNSIVPSSLVYVQNEVCQSETVVLVSVLSGSNKPYSVNGKFYRFVGESVCEMLPSDVSQHLTSKNLFPTNWEEEFMAETQMDVIDMSLVEGVLAEGKNAQRIPQQITTAIGLLDFAKLHDLGRIRKGAVALFGKDDELAMILPQCRVRLQIMLSGIDAVQYEEVSVFSGNLLSLHRQLMDYYRRYMSNGISFMNENGQNERTYVIPVNVYDEMITNALIHNDYSCFWDEIKLFVYADRVECTNPGMIPVSIYNDIGSYSHLSIPKNPMMANIFYMNGLMEKSGRGIRLMQNAMQDRGYRKPEWKCRDGYTTVTVYTELQKSPLGERLNRFLRSYPMDHEFSRSDYQQMFPDISERTAKNDLRQLVERGFCTLSGSARSARYKIIAR